MTRRTTTETKKQKKTTTGTVKSFIISKTEIRVRELEDGTKRAALYLHSGKKRFTLEYLLDAGIGNGYFPLIVSEVSYKEEI